MVYFELYHNSQGTQPEKTIIMRKMRLLFINLQRFFSYLHLVDHLCMDFVHFWWFFTI